MRLRGIFAHSVVAGCFIFAAFSSHSAGDQWTVPVEIAGREFVALVDTGSNYTVIDPDAIGHSGWQTRPVETHDGHGSVESALVSNTIRIAYKNSVVSIPEFLLLDLPEDLAVCGAGSANVILGYDFLKHFRIDIFDGYPELLPSSDDLGEQLGTLTPSEGYAVLAFLDGYPASLLVDTGDVSLIGIDKRWAESSPIKLEHSGTKQMAVVSGTIEVTMTNLGQLSIGDTELQNVPAQLPMQERLSADGLQGTLGLESIRRMFAMVDLGNLTFTPRQEPYLSDLPRLCSP